MVLHHRCIVGKGHIVGSAVIGFQQRLGTECLRCLNAAIIGSVNSHTAIAGHTTYRIGKRKRRQSTDTRRVGKRSEQPGYHLLRRERPCSVMNHYYICIGIYICESIAYRFEAGRPTVNDLWRVESMPVAQSTPHIMVVPRQHQCDGRPGHTLQSLDGVHQHRPPGQVAELLGQRPPVSGAAAGSYYYYMYLVQSLPGKHGIVRHDVVDSGAHIGDHLFILRSRKHTVDKFDYGHHKILLGTTGRDRGCAETDA